MEKNKSREAQIKARFLAVEEEISQLKRDLELGQKTLDEGAAKLKAIHLKHQQNVFTILDIKFINLYTFCIRMFFLFSRWNKFRQK